MSDFDTPIYKDFPLINSVLLGIQKGKVYKLSDESYRLKFVIHNSGFGQYFLTGEELKGLKEFLQFVKMSPEIPAYFHLYDCSESIVEEIKKSGLKYKKRLRKQLRFFGKIKTNFKENMPKGYKLVETKFIEERKLINAKMDLHKNFWESYDSFINKGYGSCLLNTFGDPVSICLTAGIDSHTSEIDILTIQTERGKGFGKLVTEEFIRQSKEKNKIPSWDCFIDNFSSLALAKQCGFSEIRTYNFISLFDPTKNQVFQ